MKSITPTCRPLNIPLTSRFFNRSDDDDDDDDDESQQEPPEEIKNNKTELKKWWTKLRAQRWQRKIQNSAMGPL